MLREEFRHRLYNRSKKSYHSYRDRNQWQLGKPIPEKDAEPRASNAAFTHTAAHQPDSPEPLSLRVSQPSAKR